MAKEVVVAAALIKNSLGELLLVRKRGTNCFILPGGKIEPGETPLQTLVRELYEELGATFQSRDARYCGVETAPAANEPNMAVIAHVLAVDLDGDANPMAEIEEIIWIDVLKPQSASLAPLVTERIIPFMRNLSHLLDMGLGTQSGE